MEGEGGAGTHTRKCGPAATAWSGSVCDVWNHPVAPRKPLQSLQHTYRNPRHNYGKYFSKIGDSQPSGSHHQSAHHQPPFGSQPIPQGDPYDDSPLRTAPSETLLSPNVTHSCLATFIEPQRWPFRETFSVHRVGREPRELWSVLGHPLPISVSKTAGSSHWTR